MDAAIRTILAFIVLAFAAKIVSAQPRSRAEQIEQQRAEMAKRPAPRDADRVEEAIKWMNDHRLFSIFSVGWRGLTPTIGGMINRSGFSGGAQFLRQDLWDGNLIFRTSARLSTRAYQLYDFEMGLPRLASDRVWFDFYARHRNYPQIPYFGPGQTSARIGKTNYRLEDTSYDISAGLKTARWLRLGVTAGLLEVNTGPGTDRRYASAETLYTPDQTPGIDRQSNYRRGGVLAHFDFRDSAYGPRAGGQYYGRFDYYDDRTWGEFSFRRLTAEVQQFVPLFNKKRVLAGRAKSVTSWTNTGQRVPFYLQPSLGGSDDLRGYQPFRFHEANSFVMNGEWRWEILSGVDGALFVDAGKVFGRPGLMNLSGLRQSYGAGLRFRAPMTGALVMRLDIGVSREGVQMWFVFNDLFAAPQIRTGRELSPRPGRLP